MLNPEAVYKRVCSNAKPVCHADLKGKQVGGRRLGQKFRAPLRVERCARVGGVTRVIPSHLAQFPLRELR